MSTKLLEVLKKPSTLDEQVASICQAGSIVAISRIKEIIGNKDGYGTDQVRLVLETAQSYEVRTKTQRPAVRQMLRNALKKLPADPKPAAPNTELGLVVPANVRVITKPDPAWDNARLYYRAVRTTGRQFIVAQICLGWELHSKKQTLGFVGSGRRKESGGVATLGVKTWEQWIHQELSPEFPRRSADDLINTFLGFCEKCPKKVRVLLESNSKRSLITTLSKPPTSLSSKERDAVETAIAKASDGETQRSLLEALRLVKVHKALTGGDTSGSKKDKPSDAELMGQLAFKFFQPIAEQLHGLRTNPDREAFLHTLPIVSSEDCEISLTSLENDLEAALHDVRAAKKLRMKPATGKVIN